MTRKIASSDSGSGAGIQADLKILAFQSCLGTSTINCVTAQNTLGVTRVDALPISATIAQIETIVKDIGVQATKTGILLSKEIISAVAEQVETLGLTNLVVAPMMGSRARDQPIDDIDVWFDGHKMETLKIIKVDTTNKRVTGCTLSAAIAANLALGKTPRAAVEMAKNYVPDDLKYALCNGPVTGHWDTFFRSCNRANR